MAVIDDMRSSVDATIARLASIEFDIDPIAGPEFSRIPSVMGSVQKRHGLIIEEALRRAVASLPGYVVWHDAAFKVSRDANTMVSKVNRVKRDPDWLGYLKQKLEYGHAEKTLQLDLAAFHEPTKRLLALEVKRGHSTHDAGKKKAILQDALCLQMLLESYGHSKGFEVESCAARICDYYGSGEFHPAISINRDGLDDFFGGTIEAEVESVNLYFKESVHTLLRADAAVAAD